MLPKIAIMFPKKGTFFNKQVLVQNQNGSTKTPLICDFNIQYSCWYFHRQLFLDLFLSSSCHPICDCPPQPCVADEKDEEPEYDGPVGDFTRHLKSQIHTDFRFEQIFTTFRGQHFQIRFDTLKKSWEDTELSFLWN